MVRHKSRHPTYRQTEALRAVHRGSTTLRDVAESIGLSRESVTAARQHVLALESHGMLTRNPLRVTAAGRRWLGQMRGAR